MVRGVGGICLLVKTGDGKEIQQKIHVVKQTTDNNKTCILKTTSDIVTVLFLAVCQ